MELRSENVMGPYEHPEIVTHKPWKSKLNLLLKKPVVLKKCPAKKIPRGNRAELEHWSQSLHKLLTHRNGVALFLMFLTAEFCEENVEFWLACEDYRLTKSSKQLHNKAKTIYEEFICEGSPKEVNLDFYTRECVCQNIQSPTIHCFEEAQKRIYYLMETDSYPRFLKSDICQDLRASEAR